MAGYLPGLDTMPPASIDPEGPTEAAEQQQKEKILSAVAAAAERQRREKILRVADKCCRIFAILVFVCAVIGVYLLFLVWLPGVLLRDPSYAVAIDSISGLTANRTDLALDPEFHLILRVASLNPHHNACVQPGTYLEVAYRSVTLATTATMTELCARPRERKEQQLVATGTRVCMPGAVLDSLTADMRHGQLVFQVTVRWSGKLVASCGGRQVGAADHDLETTCDVNLCPDT